MSPIKTDKKRRADLAIVTVSVGLALNVALFLTKLFIGLSCNSISILTDAVNNLGDTFSCVVSVLSFILIKKRNESLSFGYGRLEYVADFLMSVILCIVGGSLAYSAVERMILPSILTFTWRYFAVISVTAGIKVGMGFFYLRMNKKIDSVVLKASAFDSFTDAGITTMTLMGYALNRAVKLRLDAIFGIAVSVFILVGGVRLLVKSVKVLLGEKLPNDERERINALIAEFPAVKSVESAVLHRYGAEYSELVAELVFTSDITYDNIIYTVENISQKIEKEFGYCPKICIARKKDEQKREE